LTDSVTEEKIKEILEGLRCILEAHDSCAELVEFKEDRAVIHCGGPCIRCDNRCIEEAITEKFPNIKVIIE
jgi:hypothetical protein